MEKTDKRILIKAIIIVAIVFALKITSYYCNSTFLNLVGGTILIACVIQSGIITFRELS